MKSTSLIFSSLLEMFRVIILFGLFGSLSSQVLMGIYELLNMDMEEPVLLIGSCGIMFVFFILYRNVLQFSGWYKGELFEKLSSRTTRVLVFISILLMLTPIAYLYIK